MPFGLAIHGHQSYAIYFMAAYLALIPLRLVWDYRIMGRRQVGRYGWRALLPMQRVVLTERVEVTGPRLKKALKAVAGELNIPRQAFNGSRKTAIERSSNDSYRVLLNGDSYSLRFRPTVSGMSIEVQQGLPCTPDNLNRLRLMVFAFRLVSIPFVDASGRAMLIAQKVREELDSTAVRQRQRQRQSTGGWR